MCLGVLKNICEIEKEAIQYGSHYGIGIHVKNAKENIFLKISSKIKKITFLKIKK